MNEEEFKKYVEKSDNNIKKILKDEELDFYQSLVRAFNRICDKSEKLEQALDEIEKYIKNHKRKSETRIYGIEAPEYIFTGDIKDILKIIQKAKGE